MLDTILRDVITIVCQKFGRQPEEICETTNLKTLGIDSLDIVDLVMTIEEHFDVEVPEDADFNTVGDVVNWIKEAK